MAYDDYVYAVPNYKKHPDKKPIVDVLTMVGTITVIAFVVGVTIVFVGYFIVSSLEQASVEVE